MLEIEQLRADTPGADHVLHFNNAGSGLMPRPVLDVMQQHLRLEAQIGGYEAAAQAQSQLDHTYQAIAQLLNAHPDEIAILENATRAWTMAFYSIAFKDGDRILTSVAEYASNVIAFMQVQKRVDLSIEVVPNDEHGQLSVEALAAMMDERVRCVAISHIPSQGGLIQPAEKIGAVVRQYDNALYLLDACQSVGQLVVDVEAIGCHMLSVTGRKFLRGPRGIGFLYVARDVISQLEPPLLDVHSAEWLPEGHYRLKPNAKRFENWEANIAAKIGLGVAVDYLLGLDQAAIEERVITLAQTLRAQLSVMPGVTVHDLGQRRCGIVTFTVDGYDAAEISAALREHKINTSVSPYTYAVRDFAARQLTALVRASVHYYNTEAEVARFCEVLKAMI